MSLACYAIALLWEGFLAPSYSQTFTLPFPDRPAATRAYARLSPTATKSERLSVANRLVQADPANPDSWTALCYAEWLADGYASDRALLALDRSYRLGFFDRTVAVWRISFALENWDRLTPSLRHSVLSEALVALRQPALRRSLTSRLASLDNPEGRLAALMLLTMPD